MKKYFGIFSLVLLVLTPGCSDSSITYPVLTLNKPNIAHKGVINVCCLLTDPLSGTCNLGGNIMYYHEIISASVYTEGLCTIHLYLEINCEMCDMLGMMHPEWSITQSSIDTVVVSEEGIVILEKDYPVCNRADILLNVNYLVTTEGVGIAGVSIHPVNPFSVSFNTDE